MANFWVAQFSQALFSCFLTNFKICAKRFCFAHVFLTLEIPPKQNCALHRRAHFNEILKMKINYIFTPNTLSIFVFKKIFSSSKVIHTLRIHNFKKKNDVFTQITPSNSHETRRDQSALQRSQKSFNLKGVQYFVTRFSLCSVYVGTP